MSKTKTILTTSDLQTETAIPLEAEVMLPQTSLREANILDLTYIDSLRKKEGRSLGFIPLQTYENILSQKKLGKNAGKRWLYSRILVTEDNGDLTGFCYATYYGDLASIVQIVIQEDARRWHRALLLSNFIENEAKELGKTGVKCRVAYDLESNFFWRAIGYEPITLTTSTFLNQLESKSKRPLWIYLKDFGTPLFNLGST